MHIYIKARVDFQWYFNNGYITNRDGNFCERMDEGKYYVTASGVNKAMLGESDFVTVNSEGKRTDILDGLKKPSIETMGHIKALEAQLDKQTSVHVHSPNTVALFEIYSKQTDKLEEILNNDWPELFRYTKVGKTIDFFNPGSKELHDAIEAGFKDTGANILVMKRHGVIATGINNEECKEHCVRLEHLNGILLKTLSERYRSL